MQIITKEYILELVKKHNWTLKPDDWDFCLLALLGKEAGALSCCEYEKTLDQDIFWSWKYKLYLLNKIGKDHEYYRDLECGFELQACPTTITRGKLDGLEIRMAYDEGYFIL